MHLRRKLAEGAGHSLLDDEGLGRLGAGDALVERARDAGIQLAHLAVPVQDAVLEIGRQDSHDRHDQHHDQRELPVEDQHGHHGAGHVEQRPEDVREVPRDHAGDTVGVAHHAGEKITDRRDVIEGKGQRLQVVEEPLLHVAAEVHLDAHGVVAEPHDAQSLQNDQRQIHQRVGKQARGHTLFDKIADGIALHERQHHVHKGAKAVEGQHPDEIRAVVFEEGLQTLPDAPVKALGKLFFVMHCPRLLPKSARGRRCASECHRCPGRCPAGRSAPHAYPVRRASRPPARGCGRPASASEYGGRLE